MLFRIQSFAQGGLQGLPEGETSGHIKVQSTSRAFQVLTQEIYVVSIIFCSNHNLNKVFLTPNQKPGQKPPPLLPTLGVDQGDSQETIKHTVECGLLYKNVFFA